MDADTKKSNKQHNATESSNTLRVVREDEEVDTGRPSSGAEDGDPLWVSAEVANVLVEPTQGLDLVQQAVVPLRGLITGAKEAWVFVEIKMDIEGEGM